MHRFLAYVVIGSILLHIGIKLPDIKYGLEAELATADVLTEIPWSENPLAHSNAGDVPPPPTPALSRRGLLVATGAGIGAVVVTTRRPDRHPAGADRSARDRGSGRKGPARRPGQQDRGPGRDHRRRAAARLAAARRRAATPYVLTLADLDELAQARGARCRSPASRAGASARTGAAYRCSTSSGGPAATPTRGSRVVSLEQGLYGNSVVVGPQVVGGAARHPPQRRAARPRPRLPAATDRPEPAGRAQHQVADERWR